MSTESCDVNSSDSRRLAETCCARPRGMNPEAHAVTRFSSLEGALRARASAVVRSFFTPISGAVFAEITREKGGHMSRVERNENSSEEGRSNESRQTQQGRQGGQSRTEEIPHTPSKAEGDERDIDEALRRQ